MEKPPVEANDPPFVVENEIPFMTLFDQPCD
jgi:hypothetical protein